MADPLFIPNLNMDRFYKHLVKLDFWERFTEPMPMVLTMHLITEYWLNRLIQERTRTEKWNSVRKLDTYAAKLELVIKKELLPRQLCRNLRCLNQIRNRYAHDLDYDFSQDEKITLLDHFGDQIMLGPKDTIEALGEIRRLTVSWLNEQCLLDHELIIPDKK